MASLSDTSHASRGTRPRPCDTLGVLATAALFLVLALLLTPLEGGWRMVTAVAAAFAGIHAGFLFVGCLRGRGG